MSQHPKANVTVCVRCRKLLTSEALAGNIAAVRVNKGTKEVRISADKAWKFDCVFDEAASQEAIYESVVQGLVRGCFAGFNATVLAYGQTGSGKTYTMGTTAGNSLMNSTSDGVLPRAVRDIFEQIDSLDSETRVGISVSFLEIYNEEIRDLLHPEIESKDIYLREDGGGVVTAVGVPDEMVMSIDEVMAFVELGTRRRTTAQTLMNDTSSRSHAIFTIQLQLLSPRKSETIPQKEELHVLKSKLQLVDLAGSERQKRTGAHGLRLKESVGINQGLLSLGKVIAALTASKTKNSHVPYRDSKLTRFLQDSLGGNSRTVMIACISPTEMSLHETMSTLNYASRASGIENRPVVNLAVSNVPDPLEPDVQLEIEGLQAEVKRLQQLMSNGNGQAAGEASSAATSKMASDCLQLLDGLQSMIQREFGTHSSVSLLEGIAQCKALVSRMAFEFSTANSSASVKRLESECRRLAEELNDCRANLEQDEEIFREKIKELKDARKQNHALKKELQTLRDSLPHPVEGSGLSPEQEQRLKELRAELYRKELQIKGLTEQQAVQDQQLVHFQKQVKELEAETAIRFSDVNASARRETIEEVRRLGEMAAHQRSRNDLSQRMARCEQERRRLQAEMQEISMAMADQEAGLRTCIERSVREMADAKQQLHALGLELREQRTKMGPSHPEVEHLQNHIMELDRNRRILQQTVSDASRKLETKTYIPPKCENRLAQLHELLSEVDTERLHLQRLLTDPDEDAHVVNENQIGPYRSFDERLHPVLHELEMLPPQAKHGELNEFVAELFDQVRQNHLQQQKLNGLKLELAERNKALARLTEYQQQESNEFEEKLVAMTGSYEDRIQTLQNKLRLAELALYDQSTIGTERGLTITKPRTADASMRAPKPP